MPLFRYHIEITERAASADLVNPQMFADFIESYGSTVKRAEVIRNPQQVPGGVMTLSREVDVERLQELAGVLLSVELETSNPDVDLKAIRQAAVVALGLEPGEVPAPKGAPETSVPAGEEAIPAEDPPVA